MKFAIIDAANLFNRAHHVCRGDAFTKAGMALHIIFNALRKVHRNHQVDHFVVVAEGRSWRYDHYPLYKASRKEARAKMKPQEIEEQQVFYEVLDDLMTFFKEKTRVTVLHEQGIEGDDFIARWTQLHPNDEHVIISADSDMIQLLADNVSIYDGVTERLITKKGVYNDKGQQLYFRVDGSSGKLKVEGPLKEVAKTYAKSGKELEPIDEDWYQRALFVKIIRGDSGDGIFPANPGVRYKSSSKSVGIEDAWADRHQKGFHWNNFMLKTWDKLVETAEGPVSQEVRVIDEFQVNEMLIDLTKQPQEIINKMDEAILASVQKPSVQYVGMSFAKFCRKHQLNRMSEDVLDHTAYLSAPYFQEKK